MGPRDPQYLICPHQRLFLIWFHAKSLEPHCCPEDPENLEQLHDSSTLLYIEIFHINFIFPQETVVCCSLHSLLTMVHPILSHMMIEEIVCSSSSSFFASKNVAHPSMPWAQIPLLTHVLIICCSKTTAPKLTGLKQQLISSSPRSLVRSVPTSRFSVVVTDGLKIS